MAGCKGKGNEVEGEMGRNGDEDMRRARFGGSYL